MAPKVHPNDPGTGTSAPTQDPTAVVATDLATTDQVSTDMVAVEDDLESTSAAVPAG